MTLLSLTARVSCDICGKRFRVTVDDTAPCETALGAVKASMRDGQGSAHDGVMRCRLHTAAYENRPPPTPPSMIIAVGPVPGGWVVLTADKGRFFIAQGNPAGTPRHGLLVEPFQPVFEPEPRQPPQVKP